MIERFFVYTAKQGELRGKNHEELLEIQSQHYEVAVKDILQEVTQKLGKKALKNRLVSDENQEEP